MEDESRSLKLDQVAAISMSFGGDQAHLTVAKALQNKWVVARQNLMTAAEKIIGIAPASPDLTDVLDQRDRDYRIAVI